MAWFVRPRARGQLELKALLMGSLSSKFRSQRGRGLGAGPVLGRVYVGLARRAEVQSNRIPRSAPKLRSGLQKLCESTAKSI